MIKLRIERLLRSAHCAVASRTTRVQVVNALLSAVLSILKPMRAVAAHNARAKPLRRVAAAVLNSLLH